ncbi:hypothetical protein IGI04_036752 [Brassica rapa subsp. trilocularis]|uniref:Uncharacterized protein n=2 Tax=Brassica campestris TaxID=3711 RepID=M4EVR2_BRACM|nr:uncharacterized protein LOC103838963 isoform X2 [Brassica rapa]KAG5385282.1 hypothetical protein IGI04_036752 [Brassica rapa subsp. trilocularis]
MGQDYSYTQPSSSDEFDNTSLFLAEAAMYADEAESSYNRAQPVHYPPQPVQNFCGGHATAEEMLDFQTQLRLLKDQVNETHQNLGKLEKTVCDELSQKKALVTKCFALVVCLLFCVLVLILGGRALKDYKKSI